MGGSETFDSLTDLVEHFKKTGIEEASGAFVYLRQVRGAGLAIPQTQELCTLKWALTSHLSPPSRTMPLG